MTAYRINAISIPNGNTVYIIDYEELVVIGLPSILGPVLMCAKKGPRYKMDDGEGFIA